MMEKLLKRDILVKLFSLALALLLWAVVMQDQLTDSTRTFEIPLRVKQHPIYQVYEGPQDNEMTVEVRATGKNLVVSRLKPSEIKATVDYSRITEPGKSVQADVRVDGPDRAQYHVNPKTIPVILVENKETQVPVSVEPAAGIVTYQGRDYRFTARPGQPTAPVSGRNDYLSLVARALVTLETTKDLVPNVTHVTKKISPLDTANKPVDKLATTFMDVALEWEELPPGKSLRVQPITRGTLPKGYAVSSVDVNPATVTIRAAKVGDPPPPAETVETVPIDLTNQSRSFSAAVRLAVPRGMSATVETVSVTVNIGETSAEKIFKNVPVSVSSKPPNMDVTISVTDVQLTARGAYTMVTPLDATAFAPYVDVENLKEGKHMLPVRVNRPPGVTEVLPDPAVVEVTLTLKP